jgi:hypothetical protein
MVEVDEDVKHPVLMKVQPQIEKAVEWYSNKSELRAIICGVPFIGSAMDVYFATEGQKITQKRFLKALEVLTEELKVMNESKVDKPYLETEEFTDLIVKMLEKSVKTSSEQKIRLYCKVIRGTISLDNTGHRYNAEDFLDIISELSIPDMRLASEIYKQQKDTPADIKHSLQNELDIVKKSGYDNLPSICGMNSAEFNIAMANLVRATLVQQVIGSYVGYVGDAHRITHTFRMLMALIDDAILQPE